MRQTQAGPDATMVAFRVVVCFAVLAAAAATDVQQCAGQNIPNLSENVQLSCKKTPCRLKKGHDTHISINFTPEKVMNDVKNHVTADLYGVTLPFVGVNGGSICDKIFLENGEKASCPLAAGTKYVYKDSFPVLAFYPTADLTVHWGLQDEDEEKKEFVCFEVPARIL